MEEEIEIGAAMAGAGAGAAAGTTPGTTQTNENAINWNTFTSSLFGNLGSIIDSTANLTTGIMAQNTAGNGGTPAPTTVTAPVTTVAPVTTPAAVTTPQNNYVPLGGNAPKTAAAPNYTMYIGIAVGIVVLVVGTILLTRKK